APVRTVRAAPQPTPAPAPVRIAPAPAPRQVAVPVIKRPASKPVAAPIVVAQRPVRAAPPVVLAPKPAAKPVPKPRTIVVAPTDAGVCPGITGISRDYLGNGGRYPVRCGPQAENPVTVIARSAAPAVRVTPTQPEAQATLAGSTRILPRHVRDERRAVNSVPVTVPRGYKPAWDDDRLNPHRANMSVAGYYATQKLWTNEVPRRLVRGEAETEILKIVQ
ncbi:hypothetical protein ACFQ4E_17430, partial [Litorisediminicola beolgyonensis]